MSFLPSWNVILRPAETPTGFLSLALIGGILLAVLGALTEPVLAWGGMATVILVIVTFVGLLIRSREQLLADGEWRKHQAKKFSGFQAVAIAGAASSTGMLSTPHAGLEADRIGIYQGQHGLFLVHAWRPSTTAEQVADIRIELTEHPNPDGGIGPLSAGNVRSVEYVLGPRFGEDGLIVRKNAAERFRLDISAYAPVLCLARVSFKDGRGDVLLQRYLDFEV